MLTGLIFKNSLLYILRSRFFWIWNLAALVLTFSLHHITYFDFEGGGLVSDLFLATLSLCGAVNALVYYLHHVRELSLTRAALLVLRPVRPSQIIIGRWCAFLFFQVLVSLVLALGHALECRTVGRALPGAFWWGWYLAVIQIALLASLYALVSVLATGFWALFSMIAAFLLGHLAMQIEAALPGGLSFLGSAVFCIVPDLELSTAFNIPIKLDASLAWKTAYSISYVVAVISVTTIAYRRRLFAQN